MKYELKTWKLTVYGDFDNDEQAIKVLADHYLTCSKCDMPGENVPEKMQGYTKKDPAKHVFLFVEHEVFGIKQMVEKKQLYIYPFKKEHWWNAEDQDIPTTECRYEVLDKEGKPKKKIDYNPKGNGWGPGPGESKNDITGLQG